MNNDIEYDLADVIIGRPYPFSIGKRRFCLYPATLAKMYLLKRQTDELGIDNVQLAINPFMESLRLVKSKREICCNILAYHTAPNTKKDLYDYRSITIRKNYFSKEIDDGDLASLMIMVLANDKTALYSQHLGLDKERARLDVVMKIKASHDKHTMNFNGLSIFGTFIGQLKEMGYTDDEILFERGYTYLKLMLADKVVTIHLTDEERNEVPATADRAVYDANDPNNTEKIIRMMKERGVGTD